MISRRIARYGTILFTILSFATIFYPSLTISMFALLIFLQAYIFFHADIFSGQTKGNGKWRTYRLLLFFVLCCSISIYYISLVFEDETYGMNAQNLILFMFMVVFGNLSPKIPYNRTLGFRLPWTIDDETTWRYAHRVVGYASFPCASLFLCAHIYQIQILYGISVLSWFLIPCILSYQFHKRKQILFKHSRRHISMKSLYKNPSFYYAIMFVICIIVTIFIFPYLPADLPMQFSIKGEVNWTMPKLFGTSIAPLLSLFLYAYYKQANKFDFAKVCSLSLLLLFDIALLVFIAYRL